MSTAQSSKTSSAVSLAPMIAALTIAAAVLFMPAISEPAWAAELTPAQPAAGQAHVRGTVGSDIEQPSASLVPQDVRYDYENDEDYTPTYSFRDGQVEVCYVTAGTVSYDEATNTLTLNNVTTSGVRLANCPELNIELVGTNEVNGGDWDDDGGGETFISILGTSKVSFIGFGSASGGVSCAGDVTIDNCLVQGSIYSDGNLVLSSSTVIDNVRCEGDCTIRSGEFAGDVDISGKAAISGGTFAERVRFENGGAVSGGTLRDGISCGGEYWDGQDRYIVKKGDLLVSGGSIAGEVYCNGGGAFTMTGGSIAGEVHCEGDFTLKSGSINGYVYCGGKGSVGGGTMSGEVYCEGNMTVTGGVVKNAGDNYSARVNGNFTMGGGTLQGSIDCSGNVTVSGGVVKGVGDYAIRCGRNFTMTGGSLTKSGGTCGIDCEGNFTMARGTITTSNVDYGISVARYDHKGGTCTISGGTFVSTSPSRAGIYLDGVSLFIKGGTVKIAGSHEEAIDVYGDKYRSKTYGGKVTVTGGALTATTRTPSQYRSIRADQMTNNPACLKSVVGQLPDGASFKTGGNVYKVYDYNDVILSRYGAKSKNPKFNKVTFGKHVYYVRGAGANAFKTKAGAKVKSIRFKDYVNYLGANAFAGTKALTELRIDYISCNTKYNKKGRLKSIKLDKSVRISKKAFAKCGKRGGKKLTLKCGNMESWAEMGANGKMKYSFPDAKKYKQFFRKYGLPKGAKVTGVIR